MSDAPRKKCLTLILMVSRYDPIEDTWMELPPMTSPRMLAGAVVYQDKIWIVGKWPFIFILLFIYIFFTVGKVLLKTKIWGAIDSLLLLSCGPG
jgi:hypothetical protein